MMNKLRRMAPHAKAFFDNADVFASPFHLHRAIIDEQLNATQLMVFWLVKRFQ